MTVASVKTVVEGLPELSQVKQKMPNFRNLTFQKYTQRKYTPPEIIDELRLI